MGTRELHRLRRFRSDIRHGMMRAYEDELMRAHATIGTHSASRILTRLCKHWAHHYTVTFDPDQGDIDFGGSRCRLRVTAAGLHVEVEAPAERELIELQEVVADHLKRMAKGEPLEAAWHRDT